MKYGQVDGISKPVSRLVQGTVMISGDDPEREFALLDEVVALGGNTFDTAHVYGNGANERAFGRWVRERGLRDQLVILAKGAHHNADRRRVTPFDISADLFDTLARFQLDSVDLYVLHRDDPTVPVGPIVEALHAHKEAGRISAYGGSNWSHERIAAANAYAAEHGLTPFAVSSPNLSLAEQLQPPWDGCVSISGPSGATARAYYRTTGLPIFAWSSLAGGFFSGRLRRDNLDTFTTYLDKLAVTSYAGPDNFDRLDRADELARRKGVSLPQVALAYVHALSLNVFTLVGCQTADEFKTNVEALDLALSADEVRWLEAGDQSSN